MFVDGVHVIGAVALGENPAKDLGMKRFDAAVQHLRKPGVLGNIVHLDARFDEVSSGSTRAVNADPRTL